MDKNWYLEIVTGVAVSTPDHTWDEILSQLVDTMVACKGKLESGDICRLIAIAAAIHRKGKGSDG